MVVVLSGQDGGDTPSAPGLSQVEPASSLDGFATSIPIADDDLSMEWVDIAVTDGGVLIIDCDTGFSEFREGCFWEDNFQDDPPILPNGAYRWQGFKVSRWDEDDAMNVTGGEFVPYVLGGADAAAEAVAYLRDQADAGDRALLQAVTGSRLERDLAAGVVALRRAAQAIEARRAETQGGSVHESAVPEGNAP